MQMQTPASKWEQDHRAATDERHLRIEGHVIFGYIHQYVGTNSYCWQAVRGEFRLSGVEIGSDAAMARAEEILALPIEEFNHRVVEDLAREIRKREQDILSLFPETTLLPGYQAGFAAGAADFKRKVAELLEATCKDAT